MTLVTLLRMTIAFWKFAWPARLPLADHTWSFAHPLETITHA